MTKIELSPELRKYFDALHGEIDQLRKQVNSMLEQNTIWINTTEARAMFGISECEWPRFCRTHAIPYYQVTRRKMYKKHELSAILNNHKQ